MFQNCTPVERAESPNAKEGFWVRATEVIRIKIYAVFQKIHRLFDQEKRQHLQALYQNSTPAERVESPYPEEGFWARATTVIGIKNTKLQRNRLKCIMDQVLWSTW